MAININIPCAGTDTSDATATSSDILYGKTAYINDEKVIGSIKSKSAQIITPGRGSYTIKSGQYLGGDQTIKGDSNLSSSNIKSGVSIFGVSGTLNSLEIKNSSKLLYAKARSNIDAGNFVIYDDAPFDILSKPTKCNSPSITYLNDGSRRATKYGYVIGTLEPGGGGGTEIWIYNVSTNKVAKVISNEDICGSAILPIDKSRSLLFYYTDCIHVMPISYNASSNTINIGTTISLGIGDRGVSSVEVVGSYGNTYLIYLQLYYQYFVVMDFSSLTVTIKKTTSLETTFNGTIGIALQYNNNSTRFGMIQNNGYSANSGNKFYPNCTFSSDGTITFGSSSSWDASGFRYDPIKTWINNGNGKGVVITNENYLCAIDLVNKTSKPLSASYQYSELQLTASNDIVFVISSSDRWYAYQLVAYDISSGTKILDTTVDTSDTFYTYAVFILNNKLYTVHITSSSEIQFFQIADTIPYVTLYDTNSILGVSAEKLNSVSANKVYWI